MIQTQAEPSPDFSVAEMPSKDPALQPSLTLLILLLILIPIAAFQQILRHSFVDWDDRVLVYENPYLNPVTIPHLLHFWQHSYTGLYIPVTYTVYALIAAASGPTDPKLFHAASLLLHIGCGLAVFALLRRLVKRDTAAAAGALLFVLHPMQAEPVAWIGGFDTVLCTFFSILAIWQYILSAESANDQAGLPWRPYAVASFFFALALLSKPAAVAVPVIVAILDYGLLKRNVRQNWVTLGAWFLAALILCAVTRAAQPFTNVYAPPFWERPFVAGDALAFYLAKLAVPAHLAADYGRTPGLVLGSAWGYWTWLLPAVLTIVACRCRSRWPWLLPSLAVFAAALLPVLGFVPFAFQHFSTVADRYLSLALLGPALALAYALSRTRQSTVIWLAAFGLVLLGWQSACQVRTWQDSVTLFTHSLSVNPKSEIMHYNLANALDAEGKTAEAIPHYRAAIVLNPANAQAHCNLAEADAALGRDSDAAQEFQAALQIEPDLAPALYGLGLQLAEHRQLPEAVGLWTRAARIWPTYVPLQYNLGLALEQIGDTDKARAYLATTLRLEPSFAPAQVELARLSRTPPNRR